MDKAWDFELEHGIKDLGLQLLLGHCLNQSEWFQVDLIIITVLFATLFKYLKPKWGGDYSAIRVICSDSYAILGSERLCSRIHIHSKDAFGACSIHYRALCRNVSLCSDRGVDVSILG